MSGTLDPMPVACDLLVLGSGAAGLAAAVTAAQLGLKVVVVEKEPLIGGTTAWSGGWMWVPRNPLARAAGIEEDIERPLAYLRQELGERLRRTLLARLPASDTAQGGVLSRTHGAAVHRRQWHARFPRSHTGGRCGRALGLRRGLRRAPPGP